jgi:hypothetical protein
VDAPATTVTPAADAPFLVADAGPPPEVLPMPGSAFLAVALAWASLALAFSGPAGVLAGVGAFYFRSRFRSLERTEPGHRGSRLVASVPWMAGVAIGAGLVVTGLLVVVATTTVPAK